MPSYNGQEIQHANIDFRISIPGLGSVKVVTTFSKLSGTPSAEKKPVNDSQGNITNYTIDNKKIDASVTLRLSEYRRIRTLLVRAGSLLVPQLGPMQIAMDWIVSFGSPAEPHTDSWQGVMFNADPFDSSNDQSALEVTIPLFVMDIIPETAPGMIYRPY